MTADHDFDRLDAQAKLSFRLYEHEVESAIADFQWRFHTYPVNQMFGVQSDIPAFLIKYHRIDNLGDAMAHISRVEKMKDLFDQFPGNIRVRAAKGILPPKFVFPLAMADCRNVLTGRPFDDGPESSTLLKDFEAKISKLADLSDDDREMLRTGLNKALRQW